MKLKEMQRGAYVRKFHKSSSKTYPFVQFMVHFLLDIKIIITFVMILPKKNIL